MVIHKFLAELNNQGYRIHAEEENLRIQCDCNPSKEVLDTIKQNKAEILEFIKKANLSLSSYALPFAEKKELYALSPLQRGICFLQELNIDNTSYNTQFEFKIQEKFDILEIEKTFKELLKRHEVLRSSIVKQKDTFFQKINSEVPFSITSLSFSRREYEKNKQKLIKPFELSKAPLFRLFYIKIEGEKSLLLLDMHHLISDGTSNVILFDEFRKLFTKTDLVPVKYQYKDFSEYINSSAQVLRIQKQRKYWLDRFKSGIPLLDLHTDYSRSLVKENKGASVSFVLSEQETNILRNISEDYDLTLYMSLLAICNILLAKLSGQDDIVIGTPNAGRFHADLENIVGMFINNLVMLNKPTPNKSIKSFLAEVKNNTLNAFANQEYQFGDFVKEVSFTRDSTRNPCFDVMFNLLNQSEFEANQLLETTDNLYKHVPCSAKFDLNIRAIDNKKSILFNIVYNAKLFKQQSIDRIIEFLRKIIYEISLKGTKVLIQDIELIPEHRKKKKIDSLCKNLSCKLGAATIQEYISRSIGKHGDKIAIEKGTEHISYSELGLLKNNIGNLISSKRIAKGTFIGIYLDNRIEFIASMLGILEVGCVFVPLQTENSSERLQKMVHYAGIRHFISSTDKISELLLKVPTINEDKILVSHTCQTKKQYKFQEGLNNGDDPIYIYFTSGSTGIPKPVLGKNQSLLHFIEWEIRQFNLSESYKLSQLTNVGFDAILRDIFVPLCLGGIICIPDEPETAQDVEKFANWVNKHSINLIHCVPSLFNVLKANPKIVKQFRGLKYVLMSGENINPISLKDWYNVFKDRIQLVNLYGLTEATLVKSFYLIKSYDVTRNKLPIGEPMSGSQFIILDKNNIPCDAGIPGELYIRSPYMTYGYYRDKDLTSKKFVNNSFLKGHELIFKTGDLALENNEGEIFILDRLDNQVKIRGVRVELGEIEAQILDFDEVNEVVVIQKNKSDLIAFIVIKQGCRFEVDNIKNRLKNNLPSYMIPRYYIKLNKIPLTLNGKIDRLALNQYKVRFKEQSIQITNEFENKLLLLWAEILRIDTKDIGLNTSFFDLGGHSLSLTQLNSGIFKEFGVRIQIKELYNLITIQQQSELIAKSIPDTPERINKSENKEYYNLSFQQSSLFVFQQLNKESTAYNIDFLFTLPKKFNKEKLEEVFQILVSRHASFRTSFVIIEGVPMQRVDNVIFKVKEITIEKNDVLNVPAKLKKEFNLSNAPLIRAYLINVIDEEPLLFIDLHHIICDVTSIRILVEEFNKLFNGKSLTPLLYNYIDYSEWQNNCKSKNTFSTQEEYWRKELNCDISPIELPLDFSRPKVEGDEGKAIECIINSEKTKLIRSICGETSTTLSMNILSVFSILLSRLCNQDEFFLGLTVAGRNQTITAGITGMFVNILPIKTKPTSNKSYKDLLFELKDTTLNALNNQEYPIEELFDELDIKRKGGKNPFSNVMVNVLNYDDRLDGEFITKRNNDNLGRRFDLTLNIRENATDIVVEFQYYPKIFKKSTIERWTGYFLNIVSQITSNSVANIYDIELLPDKEKYQILSGFNNTNIKYPENKTIQQIFSEQVLKTPNKIAIKYENSCLTFTELDRRAEVVAKLIMDQGITNNSIVGVMIDRSLEMITALLGIFKVGAAYLPISTTHPTDRINNMLHNSNCRIVLVCAKQKTRQELSARLINIEDKEEITTSNKRVSKGKSSDIAYVIFTSGSTGNPKGVMVEHHSVINRITWMQNKYKLSSDDVILQKTPTTFDVSVWELFWWMFTGSTLYLLEPNAEKEPEKILRAFQNEKISVVHFVPSMFNVFIDYISEKDTINSVKNLRFIFSSGEELKKSSYIKYKKKHKELNYALLVNLYGPTEATVDVTYFDCENIQEYESIPIGKPIDNTQIYILSNDLKLQPIGIPGQLCIAGVGLSRGYINNSELTNEKFISNPYKQDEIIYLTGDIAKWSSDGNIEYLGRNDNQHKIRGVRIELGEIENCVLKFKPIKECIVIPKYDEQEFDYLCTYYTRKNKQYEFNISELKLLLQKYLPDYMIPHYYVEIDHLPLTANGKINYKALPAPKKVFVEKYTAPSNKFETELVRIWSEVLDISKENISVDYNFFEIGGNSLKAIRMGHMIYKTFNVKFDLQFFFEKPKISELALFITEKSLCNVVDDDEIYSEEFRI